VGADDRFEPKRIVDALNRGGVRYVIVGGLAVGAHGVIRATRDLDLVPDAEPANMDRLARILSDLGGRHSVAEGGDQPGEGRAARAQEERRCLVVEDEPTERLGAGNPRAFAQRLVERRPRELRRAVAQPPQLELGDRGRAGADDGTQTLRKSLRQMCGR
jgi:hypothetical protein